MKKDSLFLFIGFTNPAYYALALRIAQAIDHVNIPINIRLCSTHHLTSGDFRKNLGTRLWKRILFLGVPLPKANTTPTTFETLRRLHDKGTQLFWINTTREMKRNTWSTLRTLIHPITCDPDSDDALTLPTPLTRAFDLPKGLAVPPLPQEVDELRQMAEERARTLRDYDTYHDLFLKLLKVLPEPTVTPSEDTPPLLQTCAPLRGTYTTRLTEFRTWSHRQLSGTSPAVRTLKDDIEKVGPTDHNVIILGESGTGKETVAILLHRHSQKRAQKPFVAFNCNIVGEPLFESRLLGYAKGAFTGANTDTPGIVEQANGGTLFLDEIGDLPLSAQGLLLRLLQEKKLRRIGDTREQDVDIRIIAATHRNIEDLIRQGKFRADLWYRLSVFTLHTPPLRERLEDLPALITDHFHGDSTQGPQGEALAPFLNYAWPGNVRELHNALDRWTVFPDRAIPVTSPITPLDTSPLIPENLDALKRWHITRIFQKYGENHTQAANALGISRNTLEKYLP